MPKPLNRLELTKRKELKKTYKVENRTPFQKNTLLELSKELEARFKEHRDIDIARLYLELFSEASEYEYLPNGIPYAVVDDYEVNAIGGAALLIKAFPLIFVPSYLSPKARQKVAMHEYTEWLANTKLGLAQPIAHSRALKKTSAEVLTEVLKKREEFKRAERKNVRIKFLNNLMKNEDLLKIQLRRLIAERKYSTTVLLGTSFYSLSLCPSGDFEVYLFEPYALQYLGFDIGISDPKDERSKCIAIYDARTFERKE